MILNALLLLILIVGLFGHHPANAAGPTTQAVNTPAQSLANLTARSVDLHTATGDVATIAIPSYVTAYQITSVKITNCSTTPVLAQVAVWTGAAGTGTSVVGAAVITGATTAAVVLSSTLATTNRLTAATIFINLPVANVAALTCDVKLSIDDLS